MRKLIKGAIGTLIATNILGIWQNLTSGLVPRHISFQLSRWFSFILLWVVTYALLRSERTIFVLRRYKAKFRSGGSEMSSYILVAVVSAGLGLVYWCRDRRYQQAIQSLFGIDARREIHPFWLRTAHLFWRIHQFCASARGNNKVTAPTRPQASCRR